MRSSRTLATRLTPRPDLNHVIHDGTLNKGSICRLKSYQSNFVKDKFILIVLDLDVLSEYGEVEKLGQPVALDTPKEEQREPKQEQPGNIAGNGFYGNKPQPVPQQPLVSRSNVPAAKSGSHGNLYPIEAISPYAHRWTIKARCSHKGEIKTWHNKNGEGKLFSVNFLDDSSEIRATGFNDAVDQWYDTLQEGSVYYVSAPCKVNLAKKQFSNLKNDYELTFERDTVIEKADDTEGVPQVQFNFTSIQDLQSVEKDSTIDMIGLLTEVGETSEIVSKNTGKPYQKRELTLVDSTGYNVRLTIWGKTAASFDGQPESVIAFKGVKVSDFGGRSLSLLSSGSMTVNPDIEEAYKLKGWYEGSGRNEQFKSHANTMSLVTASGGDRGAYKTIAQITDENLGQGDEFDWFSLKATIIYIKQDTFSYPACQSEGCQKKVVQDDMGGSDKWRCERCNCGFDAPRHRYIMSINVSDHTGQIWLSVFNDAAELIMGTPANDLMRLKDDGEDRRLQDSFADANCRTFVFRCKAKMDTFNDQQRCVPPPPPNPPLFPTNLSHPPPGRVRYQVQTARPLDYVAESKKLADMIKQYSDTDDGLFVS